MEDRHLISVDELRAAGALDVPPEWRKWLGGKKPTAGERQSDHRQGSLWDDDPSGEDEQPAPSDPDEGGSADEPE